MAVLLLSTGASYVPSLSRLSADKEGQSDNSSGERGPGPNRSRPASVPDGVYWASWMPEGFEYLDSEGEPDTVLAISYWHTDGLNDQLRGPRIKVSTMSIPPGFATKTPDPQRRYELDEYSEATVRGRQALVMSRACPPGEPAPSTPWCGEDPGVLFLTVSWQETQKTTLEVWAAGVALDDVLAVAEGLQHDS